MDRRSAALVLSTYGLFVMTLPRPAPAGPFTDEGTQPPLNYNLRNDGNCAGCHAGYDGSNNIEPWDTWAGSMMAHASRDPLFWAALDVANHDVPGIGDWCLRCHVPTGWLEGRSEPPGGSVDGCGLAGKLDERAADFVGISCHLCHRMMVNPSPPVGQDSVYTENGAYWLDDDDCNGGGEPCRRGPYDYSQGGVSPPHTWMYSPYLTSSTMCGNCHNVTNPAKNLIENGVDTGIPFPVERTFREWLLSAYSDSLGPVAKTCQDCHMPDPTVSGIYACSSQINDRTGDLGTHQFAGGNAWVPDVLRNEYPYLDLDDELVATRDWALDMLQNQSATIDVTYPGSVMEGGTLSVDVKVTNLTGHKLPTGYPEGRRMWINVQARDGTNALFWESGAYVDSTGQLVDDAQIKVYETKQGVWDYNGTQECDCESGGSEIFHFVLNDCVKKDNRIPPLGFTGGTDPEVKPVGIVYPEASPGVLVNWDVTKYSVPVPLGTPSPVTVSATLRYQTTSKEYVEFLLDESDTHGFPNDCIERTWGYPDQTRAEILHDMWTTYGRCPPVDMTTDAGVVSVTSAVAAPVVSSGPGLSLAQNAPNPIRSGDTRIAFRLPGTTRVIVDVTDVQGRQVRRLLDEVRLKGPHSVAWDGRDERGRAVASGVYLYRLQADGRVLSKRMIVLR